jgi:peptidyl-prolyl cis-trans isomerase C
MATLACVLLLAACGRAGGDHRPPEPGDVAVAQVSGQTVWSSDVKREAVVQGMIADGDPLDVGSEEFHRVLDEVIDQKLLAAEAAKRGLQNDPVAKRRLAAAREHIMGDLLVERMVEQAASDSAIKALYQEQLKLSHQSQEYRARQIVLASQADADAVRRQIQGGAGFEALAADRSIDAATRVNGGDLGYFTADVMPPAYGAALRDAKPGDLVGPFKSDAGWVVLKLEDRREEAPLSLEQARPQIVRFLTYDAVRDVLRKLRGQSRIQLLIGPAPAGPPEPASAPPRSAAPAAPSVSSNPKPEGTSP